MGLQASMDIYFKDLSFEKVIEQLSDNWQLNDYGSITYMDNSDFEWKSSSLNEKKFILNNLTKKYELNNTIGIVLMTLDNSGGMFIFYPNENLLSIIININRKTNSNTIFTDFSYYIERMNSVLHNNILKIIYTDIL